MTESPFFRKRRQSLAASTSAVDMSQTGSRHFLRSPSSPLGSVVSAGSLISTLTDIELPSESSCHRSEQGARCCPSCARVTNVVAKQFSHCPVFAEKFKELFATQSLDHKGGTMWVQKFKSVEKSLSDQSIEACSFYGERSLMCWEEAEIAMYWSVRHLCGFACYLRAFAPIRGWHGLRSRVCEITGRSPGHSLAGWKCLLVPPCFGASNNGTADHETPFTEDGPMQDDTSKNCVCGRCPATQIVYVDPFKRAYESMASSLKSLGLIPITKNRKRSRDSPNPAVVRCLFPRKTAVNAIAETPNPSLSPIADDELLGNEAQGPHKYLRDNRLRQWLEKFPTSPFGLLEELFFCDPWRLLLSTIMLNRTTRVQVDAVMHYFLQEWPDPNSAAIASPEAIANIIRPMGICTRRSKAIVRFSTEYVALIKQKGGGAFWPTHGRKIMPAEFELTRNEVTSLYNCGQYAYDAYKIFAQRRYDFAPSDHALEWYVNFCRGLNDLGLGV